MKTKLSVNLNKVALLRNQRDLSYPCVVDIARLVILAGADGITVHPRPDQRHIRPSDVRDLSCLLRSEFDNDVEFNIEGNPTEEFLNLISEIRPTQVTLVPDAPGQRTSDHGWDLSKDGKRLESIVCGLCAEGSRVSLFLDPDADAIPEVSRVGAHRIELYTGPYAAAHAEGDYEEELVRYSNVAAAALKHNLGVNAGHDLTLNNLPEFKKRIPNLAEVSIGHAITADALELGFQIAVGAYLDTLD